MENREKLFVMICLSMIALTVSSQNWHSISRSMYEEHKKLLPKSRDDKQEQAKYFLELRKKTHCYNATDFICGKQDTAIIIESYPEFGIGSGTLWRWGQNYEEVSKENYRANKLREYRLTEDGKIKCQTDCTMFFFDFNFRKLCNDWSFMEYEEWLKKDVVTTSQHMAIITKIIINGKKYKIYSYLVYPFVSLPYNFFEH